MAAQRRAAEHGGDGDGCNVVIYVSRPKYRWTVVHQHGEEAVSPKKMRKIIAAAEADGALGVITVQSALAVMETAEYRFALVDRVAGTTKGFALASAMPGAMYLDMLSTSPEFRGSARVLINRLLSFAKARALDVAVDATPSILRYFHQFGFQFRRSCEVGARVETPAASSQLADAALVLDRPGLTPKQGSSHKGVVFLTRLAQEGLGVGCDPHDVPSDEEAAVRYLQESQCFRRGFQMKACFRSADAVPLTSEAAVKEYLSNPEKYADVDMLPTEEMEDVSWSDDDDDDDDDGDATQYDDDGDDGDGDASQDDDDGDDGDDAASHTSTSSGCTPNSDQDSCGS